MKLSLLRTTFSFFLVLMAVGCIDRIAFPVDTGIHRVVVSGFISTDPGPYTVKISQSLDIQNPFEIAKPISVRQLLLMDDIGNVDTLFSPVKELGTYYTPEDGMRGVPGRAYKIRFETRDGSIYESAYDTLPPSTGRIDSVYTSFERRVGIGGEEIYGFDVMFDASGIKEDELHMWNFTGTYQIETEPARNRNPCLGGGPDCPPDHGNCGCLAPLECSGYYDGSVCTCCRCWVTFSNSTPVLPYLELTGLDHLSAVFVALTPYNFMYKMHANVEQYAISRQTHEFFSSIRNQQQAKESLFQPVTGKIIGNIKQLSGSPLEAEGIFYATSVTSKAIYIKRKDIPDDELIPKVDPRWYPYKKIWASCLDFPRSTNVKPAFWVD